MFYLYPVRCVSGTGVVPNSGPTGEAPSTTSMMRVDKYRGGYALVALASEGVEIRDLLAVGLKVRRAGT